MFNSYEVLPMTADGDICGLYDAAGDQVAMGSYEVCQTLLFLVTNSSLIERPRYYEKAAPRQHMKAVAPDSAIASVSPGKSEVRNVEVKNVQEVVPSLPPSAATISSDSPTSNPLALHTHFSGVEADRPGAGPLAAASDVGARRVSAERKSMTAHPVARPRRSGGELSVAPYGILGGSYLSSPSASSYWYISLYVVLIIGSALLAWALFLSL